MLVLVAGGDHHFPGLKHDTQLRVIRGLTR